MSSYHSHSVAFNINDGIYSPSKLDDMEIR